MHFDLKFKKPIGKGTKIAFGILWGIDFKGVFDARAMTTQVIQRVQLIELRPNFLVLPGI